MFDYFLVSNTSLGIIAYVYSTINESSSTSCYFCRDHLATCVNIVNNNMFNIGLIFFLICAKINLSRLTE